MAGTTISGSYTVGLTLSTPATQNPATISGTGRINVTATSGSALYGTKAAAWSVYNDGTVIGPGYGVFLAAGGVVSNGSTGLITGGYRGVEIDGAPGTVRNAGSIGGGKQQGVRLAGGGSVTNVAGGTITGGAGYASVYILHGGTVDNASGGMISSGVEIDSSTAGGTNAGVSVINAANAIITGATTAMYINLAAGVHGSIINSGTIVGNSFGIKSSAGNINAPIYVNNQSGGTIQGTVAISGKVTVVNAGLIEGSTTRPAVDVGIRLINGGAITNLSTGSIVAQQRVIYALSGTVTVINEGRISSFVQNGITFAANVDGYISNARSGFILSNIDAVGISIVNAGYMKSANALKVTNLATGRLHNLSDSKEVVNYGTILGGVTNVATIDNSGLLGTYAKSAVYRSVYLHNHGGGTIGGGNDITAERIVNGPASVIQVPIYGGIVGTFTLDNAGTAKNVSLNGAVGSITNDVGGLMGGIVTGKPASGPVLQSTIVNQGTIASDSFGISAYAGLISLTAGGIVSGATVGIRALGSDVTIVDAGTIIGGSGSAVALVSSADLLIVDPGASFGGSIVANHSRLELAVGNGGPGLLTGFGTGIVNFDTITFDQGATWTIAGKTSGLSGVIQGFAQTDTIDLTSIHETVQDYSNGTLTLIGDQTVKLKLPGNFTTNSFTTTSDGVTGTNVLLVPCFLAGTHIATPHGEVAVEDLRSGDCVLTLGSDGALMPRQVRWIGRRRIDLARHPRPEAARPIRIRRSAFSEGVPSRDLLLSPDHAIYAEDVLIPVRWLVNGHTVASEKRMRYVEYFHVELDHHAILLAENLPAESYLDTGDRSTFENGGVETDLYPDFASRTWEAGGCARLVVTGPEVERVRHRLRTRVSSAGQPHRSSRPRAAMR